MRLLPHGPTAFLIAALASAGCWTIASHDEYDAYRRIRLEPDAVPRMEAAREYRRAYPDGRMAGDVDAVVAEMDDAFFWAAGRDSPMLRFYLEMLPAGKHVGPANEILAANAYFEEIQQRMRDEQLARIAEEEERRRQWQERLRLFVKDGFRDWIMILGDMRRAWGMDMATIQRQFPVFHQYWASEPLPVCEPDGSVCRKRYEAAFTLSPEGMQPFERRLTLTVQLGFRQNRFFAAALFVDRDGFITWYEIETNTINTLHAETHVRQVATTYFVEYMNQLITASFPGGAEIDPTDPRSAYSYQVGPIRIDVIGLSATVGQRMDGLQFVNEQVLAATGGAAPRPGPRHPPEPSPPPPAPSPAPAPVPAPAPDPSPAPAPVPAPPVQDDPYADL